VLYPPIQPRLDDLREGRRSSAEEVERCLGAALDPAGEGVRVFTRLSAAKAREEAAAWDRRRSQGSEGGVLGGLPVSVKDLFDIAGEATLAGSLVLAGSPSADRDSTVVRRLREAGAVIVGRTNMTEFAYSGLGLNPHYGTPKNPYDRATGRISGGSSSGAAVSVTDGMAAVGLGTDTGGSVRIPAALCGLVGFKPTSSRVPREGMVPLSPSLDSIGPIAPTVACCALVDAVLAGETPRKLVPPPMRSLRLGVLQGYVLEGLDETVQTAFRSSLQRVAEAGATLDEVHFSRLELVPQSNQFAAAEAFAWHRDLLALHGERYDPHVAARIRYGAETLAADYLDMLRSRRECIAEARTSFARFDAILLPSVPWIAPSIADLEASDAAYFVANGAMLRNTSLFNFLDGCALSVPCHAAGKAPVGLMIAGLGGQDAQVLAIGAAIEAVLSNPLSNL